MKITISKKVAQTGLFAALMVGATAAYAGGAASTEFDSIWQKLSDWMKGGLGKVLAATLVLVGIGAGIARQSLMAFVVGVGGGIGLFYTPDIIGNLMSGTAEGVSAAIDMTNSVGLN